MGKKKLIGIIGTCIAVVVVVVVVVLRPFWYDVNISGTEGGLVTVTVDGVDTVVGPYGQRLYNVRSGTQVNVVARPDRGYEFVAWQGEPIDGVTDPETTINVSKHYSITAKFFYGQLIWDWHDLHAIRDNLGGSYLLMNDLGLTTAGYDELAGSKANDGKGWKPIGTWPDGFAGHFDGQGYEIGDLSIDRPDEDDVGLFGCVGPGGVIENVGVVNIDVTGGGRPVVSGVGGLVGRNRGAVSNSYATGSVTGNSRVGGLVGMNYYGAVSNSYATGSVGGNDRVGGLVGINERGNVSDSYFTGDVIGEWDVGGLVGTDFYGTLSNSHYNYDEVLINGKNIITIGALFGQDFREWLADDLFFDVNERLSKEDGYYLIHSVSDFKQLLAFGQDDSLRFRLKAHLDLSDASNFYIPCLAGEFDGNGHKISGLSFEFDFISHVGLFGYLAPGGSISEVGVDDVNVTGYRYVGGLVGFSDQGTVSGSHSSGVISGDSNVGGLVGGSHLTTVVNSHSSADVTGRWVGGLVGDLSYGTVSNSYSTGNVVGEWVVGGLVGRNSGTVSLSYSSGSVNGIGRVGGLVGSNSGALNSSYSTGSVSGGSYVGGLVGHHQRGSVTDSFSIGSVTGTRYVGGLMGATDWDKGATVSDSSWDIETSGHAESGGGMGKTTAEMMDIATFTDTDTPDLDEPWDMVLIEDFDPWEPPTWYIAQGVDHPRLHFQHPDTVWYPLPEPSHIVEPEHGVDRVEPEYGVDRVFPLNVVFVGFDEEAVDTDMIDENIRRDREFKYGDYVISYSFDLDYHFADSSYYDALEEFVLENSALDTTSALNATALEIQKETGQRMSIFTPQSGRAVDAVAVEDWLAANPLNADLEPTYWFYVINFTELDPVDPDSKHWYAVTGMDLEAGRMRDFWTPTEFDNPLNRGVGFPYACFTSQSRVFLIDPSAHQWYLTWARIWWGLTETGPKYAYYRSDLAEFLDAIDADTPRGRYALAHYLAGWIEDGVVNLLVPHIRPSIAVLNARSLSLQTLILNNASDCGYDNETMRWIVDPELYENVIRDLAPWMDVEVVFEFADLEDYPELQAMFEGAVIEEQNGWAHYDMTTVWLGLRWGLGDREAYFDFTAADLVIRGYVYLEKGMTARYKWNGREVQGMGGGRQLLVMREVSRYFEEDGVTPRFGLGQVFIHEAGHNLGLPHTFTPNAYAGDFACDVMGYYSPSYLFTQLWKDCFRRLAVDFRLLSQQERLDETMGAYELRTPAAAIESEFAKAYARIDEVNELYGQVRFLDAYDKILEIEASVAYLEYLIDTPLWLAHVGSAEGGSVTEPGEGGFAYEEGAVIDLVAEPDDGYRFVNWTGDVDTAGNVDAASTTIRVEGDYTVTANFVAQYDLTVSSADGGVVSIPGEGVLTYDAGTLVEFVAKAEEGYRFVNWTGDVDTIVDVGAAQTTVTVKGDYSITASFESVPPPIPWWWIAFGVVIAGLPIFLFLKRRRRRT